MKKSGIKIRAIYFPNGERVVANYSCTLETLNEFHGEYDIDWVILLQDGNETARYNTRHIESIVWLEPVKAPDTSGE